MVEPSREGARVVVADVADLTRDVAAQVALDRAAEGLRAGDGLVARVHHGTCSGHIRSVSNVGIVFDGGELVELSIGKCLRLGLVGRFDLWRPSGQP